MTDIDRAVLITELAHIRAYEHRYEDFESLADRANQITEQLERTPR